MLSRLLKGSTVDSDAHVLPTRIIYWFGTSVQQNRELRFDDQGLESGCGSIARSIQPTVLSSVGSCYPTIRNRHDFRVIGKSYVLSRSFYIRHQFIKSLVHC